MFHNSTFLSEHVFIFFFDLSLGNQSIRMRSLGRKSIGGAGGQGVGWRSACMTGKINIRWYCLYQYSIYMLPFSGMTGQIYFLQEFLGAKQINFVRLYNSQLSERLSLERDNGREQEKESEKESQKERKKARKKRKKQNKK